MKAGRFFLIFLAGTLFGMGLAVSGMTDPGRVIGFLDVFGAWDPALLFVMAGAVGVYGFGMLILRRFQDQNLKLPSTASSPIDRQLVMGAAISASAGDSAVSAPAHRSPTSARSESKRWCLYPRWQWECSSRKGSSARTDKIERIDHEHDVLALIRCSVRCFFAKPAANRVGSPVTWILSVRCSALSVCFYEGRPPYAARQSPGRCRNRGSGNRRV